MAFTHLHVHTGYSLLDGAGKIPEMVKRAKELGQESMAITDHGVMYGAVEFFIECIKQGIKPIIGCEIYMVEGDMAIKNKDVKEERYHLILLCKNKKGYQNLVQMVSKAFMDGYYYKPRVDYQTLQKYSEGLVCLSACLQGEVAYNLVRENYQEAKNVAERLQNIFGKDDFYIEIQNHGLKEELFIHTDLIRLSKEIGAKIVATNDVHYTFKEDEEAHDCLLCLQTGKLIKDEDRMKYDGGQYYIKSEEEMRESFKFCEEAIDNTVEVMEKCNVHMDFTKASYNDITGILKEKIEKNEILKDKESLADLVDKCEYHVPKFIVPDGYDNVSYLRKIVYEGLDKRFLTNKNDYIERVESELKIIIDMGFVDYFLLVWDYIHYAKTHNVPVGPGRGSGVGSLVAYLLEITNTNPITYNLFFERFLNPERVSMPDIDTDFGVVERADVIDYVREKYHSENVAQIVTFMTLGAKGSIRDIGRVLSISLQKCDKTAKLLPVMFPEDESFEPKLFSDFDKALKGDIKLFKSADQSNILEFRALYESDDEIKHIVDIASRLEGLPKSASVHASGVLISPAPVYEFVPIARSKDESLVTQYTMTQLEEVGMLKMDFLGLRNLSAINECLKNLKNKYDIDVDLDKIPYDDKNVYEMIASGDTLGIFQLESAGMTSFMKNLGPTCLDDLIAGVSLYRPGPMDSISKYVDSKKNKDNIKYDCKELKKVLESTYGCIVYQEQVMEIFRELAGFSLGRADEVRRAMSKKKKDKLMAEEKNFIYGNEKLGIDGCIKRNVDEKVAKKIFADMSSFAEYAFNKSHAAAYARLAYQTAYLKYYYRVEFYCSICNSVLGDRKLLNKYVSNIQINGVKILPCDINKSYSGFTVDDGNIRLGMASIKTIGENVANSIIEEREKNGLFEDFTSCLNRICRVDGKKAVSNKVIEALIQVGAFDSFVGNRNQKMYMMIKILDDIDAKERDRKKLLPGEKSFFDYIEEIENNENEGETVDVNKKDNNYLKEYLDVEDFDEESKLLTEKEYTGIYITGHPLNSYIDYIEDFSEHKLSDFYPDDEWDQEYLKYDNEKVKVVGIIDECKKMITKKGEQYARVELSDQYASINCVIFPKTFRQVENILSVNNIVLMEGKIQYEQERDKGTSLLVEQVSNIDKSYNKEDKKKVLVIHFVNQNDYKNKILDINNVLFKHKGMSEVVVVLDDLKKQKTLPNVKIKIDDELMDIIKNMIDGGNVDVREKKEK